MPTKWRGRSSRNRRSWTRSKVYLLAIRLYILLQLNCMGTFVHRAHRIILFRRGNLHEKYENFVYVTTNKGSKLRPMPQAIVVRRRANPSRIYEIVVHFNFTAPSRHHHHRRRRRRRYYFCCCSLQWSRLRCGYRMRECSRHFLSSFVTWTPLH